MRRSKPPQLAKDYIMKNDIAKENINYIFDILSSTAEFYFDKLKENIQKYEDIFCSSEKEKIDYYKNQFEVVKKEILNNQDKYNYNHLFEMNFYNNSIQLDKSKFELKADLFLKIPYKKLIEDILFESKPVANQEEINEDNYLEIISTDFDKQIKHIDKIYKLLNVDGAEDILVLSIRLFYFKHLLNNYKEFETNPMTVKGFEDLEIYHRYKILNKVLNIEKQVWGINTDLKKSRNKIMAIILNCSIDTAKDILDGNYFNEIRNKEFKDDEVNDFIKKLKIKNTKEV